MKKFTKKINQIRNLKAYFECFNISVQILCCGLIRRRRRRRRRRKRKQQKKYYHHSCAFVLSNIVIDAPSSAAHISQHLNENENETEKKSKSKNAKTPKNLWCMCVYCFTYHFILSEIRISQSIVSLHFLLLRHILHVVFCSAFTSSSAIFMETVCLSQQNGHQHSAHIHTFCFHFRKQCGFIFNCTLLGKFNSIQLHSIHFNSHSSRTTHNNVTIELKRVR